MTVLKIWRQSKFSASASLTEIIHVLGSFHYIEFIQILLTGMYYTYLFHYSCWTVLVYKFRYEAIGVIVSRAVGPRCVWNVLNSSWKKSESLRPKRTISLSISLYYLFRTVWDLLIILISCCFKKICWFTWESRSQLNTHATM